jgi:ABC-type transport system substrate-binding protein
LLIRALYDTVVHLSDGEVKPALAESWGYSQDGRELTIQLRKDLKFSNGRPLTAADVEFSLERVLDGSVASPYVPLLTAFIGGKEAVINSIQIVGKSSLVIRFPTPRRDFIELLAHPCFSVVNMEEVQKRNLSGGGTYFSGSASFPVSGSFKLVEWVNNRSITLEPNDQYYLDSPKLDRLELIIDRSKETTMYDFGAQNLDMVYLQSSDLETLSLEYPYITEELDFGPPSVVYFLSLNAQTQLFKSVEARMAVISALDLSQLMDASEVFEVADSPLGRLSREDGLFSGNSRMLFNSFASGNNSKQVVTLSYPPGEVSGAIAENLKSQLEKSLGLVVNLKKTAVPKPYLFDQSAHLSLVRWIIPSVGKNAFFPYFYAEGVNPFTNGNPVGEAGRSFFQQAGTMETSAQQDQYYDLISGELSKEFLVYGLVNV